MPLLLREIKKAKWYRNADVPWLGDDELQADALGDLRTANNTLSVWEITDDRGNLEAVIAAIAAGKNTTSNFDFALFTTAAVLEKKISITEEPGKTLDEAANRFHRDLVELSIGKLLALAEIIQLQATRERIIEPKVLSLIKASIENGQINRNSVSQSIRDKLDK